MWFLFVDVVSVILFSCGSCVCDFVNFVFEIVLFVNVVFVTICFERFACDLFCERCVCDLFLFVNVVLVIILFCGSCVCDVFVLRTSCL